MQPLPRSAVIGVIGAGTMGTGIAQVAAQAGHRVLLFDLAPGAAARGVERIDSMLAKGVAKGKVREQDARAALERIETVADLEALAAAALVIEAIVEDLDVKSELLRRLEALVAEEAILASNTSSLSITALGASLARPHNLVGLHFFNPAPLMRLVEVVSGVATSSEVADRMVATAQAWGKDPVRAKSTPGFIVNRVARPFYAEALRIVQEGAADPATVDAILRDAGGFRMGPFELMDLIGNDVNFEVTRSMFATCFNDPRYLPSLLQQELVAAGHLGRKTGRGWYDYADGRERPLPRTAPLGPRPRQVVVDRDMGPAETLVAALETSELAVQRRNTKGTIRVYGEPGRIDATLALTDGRSATERSAMQDEDSLVLFDLALDYQSAPRIVLAAADPTIPAALNAAVGLFHALGKTVSVIDDIPGLVLMRTLCMLVNEAADAVNQGVCTAADLDLAMQRGVNYPRGPLAWADSIGLERVLQVTENLARSYGEDRYRPSPLLRRKVFARSSFGSQESGTRH